MTLNALHSYVTTKPKIDCAPGQCIEGGTILYATLWPYSPQNISFSLTLANLLSTGQQENNESHWERLQEISFQLNRSVQNKSSLGCPDSLLVQPGGRTSSTCHELFVKRFRAGSRSLMQEAKAEPEGCSALLGRQAPPVCCWWLQSAVGRV